MNITIKKDGNRKFITFLTIYAKKKFKIADNAKKKKYYRISNLYRTSATINYYKTIKTDEDGKMKFIITYY